MRGNDIGMDANDADLVLVEEIYHQLALSAVENTSLCTPADEDVEWLLARCRQRMLTSPSSTRAQRELDRRTASAGGARRAPCDSPADYSWREHPSFARAQQHVCAMRRGADWAGRRVTGETATIHTSWMAQLGRAEPPWARLLASR